MNSRKMDRMPCIFMNETIEVSATSPGQFFAFARGHLAIAALAH